MKKWIEWVEPFSAEITDPIYCRIAPETAIKAMHRIGELHGKKLTDAEALQEFMVVYWAYEVEL